MKPNYAALFEIEKTKSEIEKLSSKEFADKIDDLTNRVTLLMHKLRKMDAVTKLLSAGIKQDDILKLVERNQEIQYAEQIIH